MEQGSVRFYAVPPREGFWGRLLTMWWICFLLIAGVMLIVAAPTINGLVAPNVERTYIRDLLQIFGGALFMIGIIFMLISLHHRRKAHRGIVDDRTMFIRTLTMPQPHVEAVCAGQSIDHLHIMLELDREQLPHNGVIVDVVSR